MAAEPECSTLAPAACCLAILGSVVAVGLSMFNVPVGENTRVANDSCTPMMRKFNRLRAADPGCADYIRSFAIASVSGDEIGRITDYKRRRRRAAKPPNANTANTKLDGSGIATVIEPGFNA